jgi:hypothetical protein
MRKKKLPAKEPTSLLVNGGFYIPMDGPWDSEEDDKAYELANKHFDELRPEREYVVLIKSCHWATHGYWVEIEEKEVSFPDRIIKGGHTVKI